MQDNYSGLITRSNAGKSMAVMNDNEKIKVIAEHFKVIMKAQGLDMTDYCLKDTPGRVAKTSVDHGAIFRQIFE